MKLTVPPAESSERLETVDRRLGRYQLRYRIAQGGMASVYLAQLAGVEGFQKWVAVKVIHPHIAAEPRFVKMFLDEARLTARIDHQNVCSVFEFGQAEDTFFLAMEYLHGEALSSALVRASKKGGLSREVLCRIVADAAAGLHAAHELLDEQGHPAEVVHRDVSPQNIFVLYNGVAKVVDFGIARSRDAQREATAANELKGKLAYMAPEQLEHRAVDRRADIWALGVVLWESTVNKRLFRRDSEARTILAVLHEDIPWPSTLIDGYPPELEEVVMRALERDVDKRYATAGELARDLEHYLAAQGKPIGAPVVASAMRELFSREIEERTLLLRNTVVPTASQGSFAPPPYKAPSPGSSEVTRTAIPEPVELPSTSALPASPVAPGPPAQGQTKLLFGLFAVLFFGALTWRFLREHQRDRETSAAIAAAQQALQHPEGDAGSAGPGTATPAPPPAAPSVVANAPLPSVPSGRALGFLTLFATPEARVFEGTRSLGETPLLRLPLSPGRHTLNVVTVRTHQSRTLQVQVRAGELTQDEVRFGASH